MQINNLWAESENQFTTGNLIGLLLVKPNLIFLLKNFAENLNWDSNQVSRVKANTSDYKKSIIFEKGKTV